MCASLCVSTYLSRMYSTFGKQYLLPLKAFIIDAASYAKGGNLYLLVQLVAAMSSLSQSATAISPRCNRLLQSLPVALGYCNLSPLHSAAVISPRFTRLQQSIPAALGCCNLSPLHSATAISLRYTRLLQSLPATPSCCNLFLLHSTAAIPPPRYTRLLLSPLHSTAAISRGRLEIRRNSFKIAEDREK